MDFSLKIFHEIVVEREGYSFKVEVHYEWLPDFCSHCQNIGHKVSSCRWLYPPKESTVGTENVNKGMKQMPVCRMDWVPKKDNPSGIGSSKAFAAPTAPDVMVQAQEHEQTTNDLIHTSTEADAHVTDYEEVIPVHDTAENNFQMVPYESPTRQPSVDQQHDLSSLLEVQISYEPNPPVQRRILPFPGIGAEQLPIMVPVHELEDSSQHMSQALLNTKVRQELALVEHLVVEGKDVDVPFTTYLSKKQRKKIAQEASYLTRSKGPSPHPQ